MVTMYFQPIMSKTIVNHNDSDKTGDTGDIRDDLGELLSYTQ